MFAILLTVTFGVVGCEKEKEYQDETPPVTGELEVEPDETELEAERELAEGQRPPVPEGEYDLQGVDGEVEVEDDEIEVEAEQEFAEGANPAFDPNAPDEQQIELEGIGQRGGAQAGQMQGEQMQRDQGPQPQPNQAVELTAVTVKPVDFIGATVQGTVDVEDVISDRGFWVNSDGNRIFAVVREDVPQHEMIDIDKGQQIQFTGILMDGDEAQMLTGKLEQETKQVLDEQPYFLAMHWKDVQIKQGASGS